jgi:diadenosine tetraphosphatase ApaH/serine/threonine PP2A family protein phosphatase
MRYAIFTDIHANLEALKAVLAKIDEIAQEEPIDEIWFLGDLVGYGPNPNECIVMLRERTDVMIAGNHDWAAVGKIDLEDFSAAARISAEWTAKELTEEHRTFLSDLPERLEIGDCTLVHGSPYGPLWEYLTSEMLAERSFHHFSSRFCFVGHTHIPVIFQQHISADYDEELANAPTLPLESTEARLSKGVENGTAVGDHTDGVDDETVGAIVVQHVKAAEQAESAYADPVTDQVVSEEEANAILEPSMSSSNQSITEEEAHTTAEAAMDSSDQPAATDEEIDGMMTEDDALENVATLEEESTAVEEEEIRHETEDSLKEEHADEMSHEAVRLSADELANSEIEELLTLLGLSQSMIQITNEMLTPPEGEWQAPEGYRFIINPGGVGQPRDGDPRAAFMIYDTERGFKFYRVPYDIEKTQEKIIKAGLPQYLALRLAYGR